MPPYEHVHSFLLVGMSHAWIAVPFGNCRTTTSPCPGVRAVAAQGWTLTLKSWNLAITQCSVPVSCESSAPCPWFLLLPCAVNDRVLRSCCAFPREDRGRSPQRDFHILFVPRRSLLCEQWLKEQGVLGSFIHREQYSLDLIPFDGDLLSMESESAFKVSTCLILEEKRDVVLCWTLLLVQQLSEGLQVTCTAGKGLAEQTGFDPEA